MIQQPPEAYVANAGDPVGQRQAETDALVYDKMGQIRVDSMPSIGKIYTRADGLHLGLYDKYLVAPKTGDALPRFHCLPRPTSVRDQVSDTVSNEVPV
jgi:hypothetical protein